MYRVKTKKAFIKEYNSVIRRFDGVLAQPEK